MATLSTNLISYWELSDEFDSHGDFHLTNNATTFAAGKIDTAAIFNGTTAYLHRPTTPSPAVYPLGAMTVAFWVNPTDDAATSIYVSQYNASVAQAWQIFQFSGTIYARIHQEPTGTAIFIGRLGGTITEAWQFVVVTYNGGTAASGIKIYRNATQVDTTDTNNGSFTSQNFNATPLLFGCQLNLGSIEIPLAGALDEVGLWSRVLNGAEITWLYNSGTGRTYAAVAGAGDVSGGGGGFQSAWARSSNVIIGG